MFLNVPHTKLGWRSHISLRINRIALLCASILTVASGTAAETRIAAKWSSLDYSFSHWMGGSELTLHVMPDGNFVFAKEQGLKVDMQWLPDSGDVKIFENAKFRLHYPDGRVVEPLKESFPFLVTAGVLVAGRSYVFPFGDNSLTEAWFELRAGDRTFWFEVPYGFTRDPGDTMPPSDRKGKPQGFVPAMSLMKKEDVIVRWNNVRYKFGAIQNGWDLDVNIAHRGPILCITELRRPEGRWAIYTPVVTVNVVKDSGGTISGEQSLSRLESPTCRVDEFELKFDQLTGRNWADLVVTVDGVVQSRAISLGTFLEGMWIPPSSQ